MNLLTLLLFLVAGLVNGKLTAEEKKILREAADNADIHIRQVLPNDIPAFLSQGYHLLFFGAVWCRLTQRFTPQWLAIQDEFDRRGWNTVPGFGIAKVQCAGEVERWCYETMGVHEGYPALFLYKDGKFLEEYMHHNDYDTVMVYLANIYDLVKAEHVENNVHGEILAEVEKPKEEGPARKPVHHKLSKVAHLDDNIIDLDAVDETAYQKELTHAVKEYNDELSLVRISLVLVLSVACLLAIFFGITKNRNTQYHRVN